MLEVSHISKTQLYRHLRILDASNVIALLKTVNKEPVIATTIKGLSYEEFKKAVEKIVRSQNIYDIAETLIDPLKDLEADFFGAVKLYFSLRYYSRVTHDINIVVTSNNVKLLDAVLKDKGIVFSGVGKHSPFIDLIYEVKYPNVYGLIYVMVDTLKHPLNRKKVLLDFRDVLSSRKEIPLEYVLVGKLLRTPQIIVKNDGYDIYMVLGERAVDIYKVRVLLEKVIKKYPEMREVVKVNIQLLRNKFMKYYAEPSEYIPRVKDQLEVIEDLVLTREEKKRKVLELEY